MKKSLLQDVANTLPRMLMGERLVYPDIEHIAESLNGSLTLDLLSRETTRPDGSVIPFQAATHLSSWLTERLAQPLDRVLRTAHLRVTFRTDRIPTDRTRVLLCDWDCISHLEAIDGTIRTGKAAGTTWYERDPASIKAVQ